MRRWRLYCTIALVVGALAGGEHAGAQEDLRGRAVDEDSAIPIVGALVIALDGEGVGRAQTLTDEQGDFVLRAPASVVVRGYRVVRIGYASQEYPASALSSEERRLLRVPSSPVELEGIGVVAEGLCGARFEGSARVYDIWLETRKALEMTRLTQAQQALSYDEEAIIRLLDPRDLSERERQVVPRALRGETPYYTLTTQQMTESGWVGKADDGSLVYWAPDATTLLSPEFEEQHCFGAELRDDEIVLRFAPNRDRGEIPDIRGEIFLDRGTNRLERLSFEYTSLPLPEEAAGLARGEVSFRDAPNGMWVVSDWWIRMPVVTLTWRSRPSRSVAVARVRELYERGGRVLRLYAGTDVIELQPPPPA
jgi:hypothetical protein